MEKLKNSDSVSPLDNELEAFYKLSEDASEA
jgi:hypothetical protein